MWNNDNRLCNTTNLTALSNKNKSNPLYRPELDGLRAFAILIVMVYHFNNQILPSGFVGVDIFFVISGYLVTLSFANKENKSLFNCVSKFYVRRIKRLWPALVIFSLINGLLICLINPFPQLSLRTGIASLFGVSNIYLLKQSTNYFTAVNELNGFLQTWSLGIEIQFYLIFPFLVWFSGFGRKIKRGSKRLLFIVSILTVCSFTFFVFVYFYNRFAFYFLFPSRFWEIGIGVILYLLSNDKYIYFKKIKNLSSELILFLIILVLFIPENYPILSIILTIILVSILEINLQNNSSVKNLLTKEKIIYMGSISYSLYLYHWGVLSLANFTVGISLFSAPFLLMIIFLLSHLSYIFLEHPYYSLSFLKNKNNFNSFLFFLITPFFLYISHNEPLKTFFYKVNSKILPSKYKKVPLVYQNIECFLPDDPEKYFKNCFLKDITDESKRNIFLIGDSHMANHYLSIKESIKKTNFAKVSIFTDYGLLDYLSLTTNNCLLKKRACIKNSWNKYLDFFKKSLNSNDLVIFSWATDRIKENITGELPRKTDAAKISFLKKRLIELAKNLQQRNIKLLLVDDIPQPCEKDLFFEINVIRKGDIQQCLVTNEISKEDRKELTEIYKYISREFINVSYLDFHDYLCNGKVCGVLDKNDKIIYGDASPHIRVDNGLILTNQWYGYLKNF